MARINPEMFRSTMWDEMPTRPKYDAPEAKYFMCIDHQISEMVLYQYKHDEMAIYRELMHTATKQIADYMMKKHSEELRRGHSQMVAQHHDFARGAHIVQMGVYILTPEEMDNLKAEWLREYQEREKARAGRTGTW